MYKISLPFEEAPEQRSSMTYAVLYELPLHISQSCSETKRTERIVTGILMRAKFCNISFENSTSIFFTLSVVDANSNREKHTDKYVSSINNSVGLALPLLSLFLLYKETELLNCWTLKMNEKVCSSGNQCSSGMQNASYFRWDTAYK